MSIENFNLSSKTTKRKNEKIIPWERIKKTGQKMALATLLSLPWLASNAIAQEKGDEGLDKQAKIEALSELQKTAAEHVKNLTFILKEKGDEDTMGVSRIPVRKWISPDKKLRTVVGYANDKETPKWILIDEEDQDGSRCYFDKDADGSIDRVIFNEEQESFGAEQRSANNHLKIFLPMEVLARDAKISANLKPEKVVVFDFKQEEDGSIKLNMVDYESGKTDEEPNLTIESFSEVQKWLNNSLKSIEEQIDK